MEYRISSTFYKNRSVILCMEIVVSVFIMALVVASKDEPITRYTNNVTAISVPAVSAEPMQGISQPQEWIPAEADVVMIVKTLYNECRGVDSDMEKAAVVWCILNRVDSTGYGCGNSIEYVLTFPNQFAYDESAPVWDSLKDLAIDVLIRWNSEKDGANNVGRVLPAEYIFFSGDGKHNYFTVEWKGKNYWNWSLANPYED